MNGAVFLPQGATGSRRAASTRDAAAASREAAGDRPEAPAAARIAAVPAPRPKAPRAAARPGPRGAPGGDNLRPPCGRCSNRRQSAASTIRRHAAVERRDGQSLPGHPRSSRKGAKVAPVRITQRTRSQLQPDWPFCLGIGGRIKSESVAALPRNAQLGQAVAAEVAGFVAAYAHLTDSAGRRRIVRHGHLPEHEIQTGIGPVAVRCPRVRDRGAGETGPRIRFTSRILPPRGTALRRWNNTFKLFGSGVLLFKLPVKNVAETVRDRKDGISNGNSCYCLCSDWSTQGD